MLMRRLAPDDSGFGAARDRQQERRVLERTDVPGMTRTEGQQFPGGELEPLVVFPPCRQKRLG